jgi:hypothetical protein
MAQAAATTATIPALLRQLTQAPAAEAWPAAVAHALAICRAPLTPARAVGEVVRRERELGALDNLLAGSAWDLWHELPDCVETTTERLVRWWAQTHGGKAALVLDGLSLRELPWLLQGAAERGYTTHAVVATACELPGNTQPFAKALGFTGRSALAHNGSGAAHRLTGARTEHNALPWEDCAARVDAHPHWVYWHAWPDDQMHDGSGAGQGLDLLTKHAVDKLTGDAFWAFARKLAQGRRLVITSDHGYAATGYFADADDRASAVLKPLFGQRRSTAGAGDAGELLPPVLLQGTGSHGTHRQALGRWKWKAPGGYPTLAHGGLTLLEVLSPFVELSAPAD